MAQPDREQLPDDPLFTGGLGEAAAAMMELIVTMQKAGLKRLEAIYFCAIYFANMRPQGDEPET